MPGAVIRVDIGPIIATVLRALPSADDRVRMLRGLAASARASWVALAQSRLHSTSRDYIQSIQEDIGDDHATLTLEGMLANMVEQGWEGGDLRQWLLKGKSAKQGKNGPYAVIPFGHGSPGSGGRNVGNPMPTDIHDAAKKLAPTLSRPGKIESSGGRTTVYGQRLSPMSRNVNEVARRLLTTKMKPWHSTSIYMGMIREAKQFASGRTQTTGYSTFRTISMHSNAEGKHWFHPGIRARHLAREVTSKLGALAKDIVEATLKDQTGSGTVGRSRGKP